MSHYKDFAILYDDLMAEAPYEDWVRFTKHFIENKKVHSFLDLGCGTGEITLQLAKNIPVVYGVDLSAHMLAIARKKAEINKQNITWIQQDIRYLEGFSNVDLCVSYCDVMNYIVHESDLQRTFELVYASLADDGLFIFDVHSLYHVENNLIKETFAHATDSMAYIWDCFPGDHPGEMYHEMTFFYENKKDGNTYARIDEVHHQRTFSVETYLKLLEGAGFNQLHVFSDFSTKTTYTSEKAERIFFIAYK